MKRKIKALLYAILLLAVGMLSACGKASLPYHAIVLANGHAQVLGPVVPTEDTCFTETFWRENIISGISYENENRDPDDADSEQYITYTDVPSSRTLAIVDRETYERTFKLRYDVDFAKEMVLVYMTSGQPSHRFVIKDILVSGQSVSVVYDSERAHKSASGMHDATEPTRVWVVLKMDLQKFETIEFKRRIS